MVGFDSLYQVPGAPPATDRVRVGGVDSNTHIAIESNALNPPPTSTASPLTESYGGDCQHGAEAVQKVSLSLLGTRGDGRRLVAGRFLEDCLFVLAVQFSRWLHVLVVVVVVGR